MFSGLFGLALALLFPVVSNAQTGDSTTYLPIVQALDGMDLGLAFSNPTLTAVKVTLTARSYSGVVITGKDITNPATIDLAASGQRAVRAIDVFGGGIADKRGWIEVRSSSSAITGFFLAFDSGLTSMDGAALQSAPSSRIIFPKITATTESSSFISVVNVAPATVSASASLYDDNGNLIQRTPIDLEGYSGFSRAVTDLFPSVRSMDGYAVVETAASVFGPAKESLIGLETYQHRSDIAVLNGASESASQRTGYLPHFVNGAGYRTTVTLVNYSGQAQDVRLTAVVESTNTSAGTIGPTAVRNIPAHGRLSVPLEALFGFAGGTMITGYLQWEVQGNTAGLLGALDYGTTDGVLLTAIPAQTSFSDLLFSQIAQGAGYYTGLAFLNPNPNPSTITVAAFDPAGKLLGMVDFVLAPGERRARVLQELLPALGDQLGGYVRVTATKPIFAFEVFGSASAPVFLANAAVRGAQLQPQFSGRAVSAATGATVLSANSSSSISFPPGALGKDTVISLGQPALLPPAPSLTEKLIASVEALPSGTQLTVPVPLTFPLAVQLEPGATLPVLLFDPNTIRFSSAGTAVVDDSGRTATTFVTHFSTYVVALSDQALMTLDSISPASARPGAAVTISGKGFSSSVSENIVTFAGADNSALAAVVSTASPTSLKVTVPAGAITGNLIVKVGDKSSVGVSFTVQNDKPKPVVDSITPVSIGADSTSVEMSVAGSSFDSTSQVQVDGTAMSTTYADPTLLTAHLSGAALFPGEHHVRVFSPAPGGGTSDVAKPYVIGFPVPAIKTVSPGTAQRGQSLGIAISGTGFTSQSKVVLNDSAVDSTFVDSATLQFPLNPLTAGNQYIVVVNPAPMGGTSNSAVVSVSDPAPPPSAGGGGGAPAPAPAPVPAPAPEPIAIVALATPSGGSAQVATQVPITVELRAAGGQPLSARQAAFAVTSGGGSLNAVSAASDGLGRVTVMLTLGFKAGLNRVVVTAEGVSTTFDVSGVAGPATQLVVSATPDTVAANSEMTLSVTARDQFGNAATIGTPVSLSSTASSFTFGTVSPVVSGAVSATFKATRAQTYQVTASSTSLSSSSIDIVVIPAVLSTVALSVSPLTATADVNRVVTIKFQDDFGNVVTSANNAYSLSLPSALIPTIGFTRTNGVVEQPIRATVVGTYRIAVASTGLISTPPVDISVTAAPAAKLVVSANPSNIVARMSTTLTVAVTDAFNNVVASANPPVTLNAVSTGFGTFGTLSTFANGIANASFQSSIPASYSITAAASGLAGGSVNVNVAAIVTTGYTISTVAGQSVIAEGGQAADQSLSGLSDVAIDASGNLYIPSSTRHKVFRLATDGTMTTVAGTGTPGPAGDGGPALLAQLKQPTSVALDASGNLYIADTLNQRVRMVTPDGTIRSFAGTGEAASAGDGGLALLASLNRPGGLSLDASGNLYISEVARIRKVERATGRITTIAGTGNPGFTGDGGPATAAQLSDFSLPNRLAFDASGNLYIPDTGNGRIRRVNAEGIITTFAGTTGITPNNGNGGPATAATMWPSGLVMGPGGVLYVISGDSIRKILPDGTIDRVTEIYYPSGGVALDAGGNIVLPADMFREVFRVTPGGTA